jgi:hypothetical protein
MVLHHLLSCLALVEFFTLVYFLYIRLGDLDAVPCADILFYIPLALATNIRLFCGLYYKTITIVIMMIISDATIWSITYDCN